MRAPIVRRQPARRWSITGGISLTTAGSPAARRLRIGAVQSVECTGRTPPVGHLSGVALRQTSTARAPAEPSCSPASAWPACASSTCLQRMQVRRVATPAGTFWGWQRLSRGLRRSGRVLSSRPASLAAWPGPPWLVIGACGLPAWARPPGRPGWRRPRRWPGPGSVPARSRRCGSGSRPAPRWSPRSGGRPGGRPAPGRSRWGRRPGPSAACSGSARRRCCSGRCSAPRWAGRSPRGGARCRRRWSPAPRCWPTGWRRRWFSGTRR